LSAALIVKNEEACLEGCLLALRGVADEIVVVDTGSCDGTRSIAERAGARVFDFGWTDDFSAARNEALRHCRGRWILVIDADERLREVSRAALTNLLTDPTKAAYYVLFHRRPGFTPNWQMRLFRNHPAIRYEGKMHENIYPGIDHLCQAEQKRIGYSCLIYDHFGYEGNQDKKNRRNRPLLLEALKQKPWHIFIRCHLARIHEALGEDHLACEVWTSGVKIVRKKQDLHIGDSYPYVGLIEFEIRKGGRPCALIAEAREIFPGNLQLMWYQARLWMEDGRYDEAIPLFEQLAACGTTNDFDHSIGYDRRLLDVFAFDSLAVCHFSLGNSTESTKYRRLAECHRRRNGSFYRKETTTGDLTALSIEPAGYYGNIRNRDESPDPALFRLGE